MKNKLRAIWFILKTDTKKLLIADINEGEEGTSFYWGDWEFVAKERGYKLVVK